MVNIKSIASGFAFYLADEFSIDERSMQTIRYGLEIIIGLILEGMIVMLIAYMLGIVPYVLASLITSISFRLLSGGVHFSTYIRCTVFSTLTAIFISYLAIELEPFLNITTLLCAVTLIGITGLYFVIKWAPADTSNKPITKENKRYRLKRLSELYVFVWAIALVVLILALPRTALLYSLFLASTGGFILQMVSICPLCYRLASFTEELFDKYPF